MCQTQVLLYKKAVLYRRLGYAVIPIHGRNSPTRFKAAAIRWSGYQKRLPSFAEIEKWFQEQSHAGLAIVCGRVSRLAVLDFDDPVLASTFAELYPDLAETYTVRSGGRGLPHYYFHIPPELETRSRSLDGADWQFEGRYVVAAPTQSETGAWRVVHDTVVRTLSESDLERIMTFLGGGAGSSDEKAPAKPSTPAKAYQVHSQAIDECPSAQQIISYYRAHLDSGRNNALFRTCCWIRDRGGSVEMAMSLMDVYAHTQPTGSHTPETPAERRGEALRTITSAFSRPANARHESQSYQTIPNSLREAMLKRKQTATLRVLESAVACGWKTGIVFGREQLLEAARANGIGEWSVRKALKASTPDMKPIFRPSANGANAAAENGDKPPKLNAIELRVTEPTKNQRGRPCHSYTMPDLRALCACYGVRVTWGDAIEPSKLGSVADYRQALHVALVRRRSGQYYKGWLANRLGVSKRTLSRYNVRAGIRLTPMYRERHLSWKTLSHMPVDLGDTYGAFIEDSQGKRYPPLLPIAQKLLRQRKQIVYKRRLPNHYSLPLVPEIPQAQSDTIASEMPDEPTVDKRLIPQPDVRLPAFPAVAPTQAERARPTHSKEAEEAVSRQLHAASRGTLSLRRARRLVAKYGRFACADIAKTLRTRGASVKNPAGLATKLLTARYDGSDEQSQEETALAEALYLEAHWRNPKRSLRWDLCQRLVREYGAKTTQQVLTTLRGHKRGNLTNPAGFIVAHLERLSGKPSQTNEVLSVPQAVRSLVKITREINEAQSLSTEKAQAIVKKYGSKQVAKALRVLQSRQNIHNPAGFIIVFLRSEAKGVRKSAVG